jgi:elongation factor P
MLNFNEIKLGSIVKINNAPYTVVASQHLKMGRGGAVLKTKLKNLLNGSVLEHTFKGSDKAEEADIVRSKSDYLYNEGEEYFFMDQESFEQFSIEEGNLGSQAKFLKEGITVDVLNFEGNPVSIKLPIKIELKVTSAPPGIKGDTASGATKQIELETGATINAPLFVNADDSIRVNTETGDYVERV